MTSASPLPATVRSERSHLVTLDVDADLPATISQVRRQQSFLTTTFGSEDSAQMLAREAAIRNERRVDLLTKRLNGQLTVAEADELERLQAYVAARFRPRLQARNAELRKLLRT
jgi:hypothetical protein